jgi:hypothetical protein
MVLAVGLESTSLIAAAHPVVSSAVATTNSSGSNNAASVFDEAAWETTSRGDIDPKVFALALHAAASAIDKGQAADPATLTVIDFSKPSTMRRMWVYDLRERSLVLEDLVSHGRGSGRELPTVFSNQPGSYASSLGLFRTGDAYVGKNGYSLRLDGLEPGFNDRARERAIVIHGAPYVSAATAKALGFLGRSQGCPAVRPEIAHALIDTVKGGGLLFAYYPDPAWLKTSQYLN